ncbi:MAG TPA: N-acetylglucosamine-6-phosphate deacetylase [Bacteroidales bacterium]|nr:N-acetylglucosamine-6-phosphate deacetylase [Bacteroidales bacterium]
MKITGNNIIEGLHYGTGKPVRIEVIDGLIAAINDISYSDKQDKYLIVAPGLIDNQINGYAGVDFSGDELSAKSIAKAARAIWRDGVTTFLPTILTNGHENLIKNFTILDDALNTEVILHESIPGFHLEGPYISPDEGYRGCHPLKHIRKPSWKEFMVYQKAAGGKIIQVTLAPEIEGAMEFIRECVKNEIIVAIGHTNASSDQISEAVDAGARISTHLGNGCANFIHRHKNPIWPQLANDLLTPTLIADGLHLNQEELKVFYKVKGSGNIILTSDVTYLGGMPPGRYSFLDSEVVLTEEGMLLNTELNCLAGASFPLKKGVENVMNFTGCLLSDALKMASENASKIYGLHDRENLDPGKRADIILFELTGNKIKIEKTFLKGELVFHT